MSKGCQSESIHKTDASTSSLDNVASVQVQCNIRAGVHKALNDPSELLRIEPFILSVGPLMEQQLALPTIPPVEYSQEPVESDISLQRTHTIQITGEISSDDHRKVLSAWPCSTIIAICFAPFLHQPYYCGHALQEILLVSETSGDITTRIRIPACVSILYANHRVKNILVAGTVLGDLYIWKLNSRPGVGSQRSYEKLFHGEFGMITTLSWFPTSGDKTLLIGGHMNGVDTWVYHEQHQKVDHVRSYSTEHTGILNPVRLIETVTATSFCLSRRGYPPTIFDLNKYSASCKTENGQSSGSWLGGGKECTGISSLLEISAMKLVSHQLMILSKYGDLYVVNVDVANGSPETSVCLYRLTDIKSTQLVLINNQSVCYILCQKADGNLKLVNTCNGKGYQIQGDAVAYISGSSDDRRVLTYSTNERGGTLVIYSIVIPE